MPDGAVRLSAGRWFVRIQTVPSIIKTVTWDCSDAIVLARFWAAALGSDVDEDSTQDKAYVEAAGWGAPNMWFNRVPEPKTTKNRLHFDLRAPADMDEEVKRLQELGAVVMQRDAAITVMQDPEGNEFCVEPGPEPIRDRSRSS
jgi:Glyoxalase-like domain